MSSTKNKKQECNFTRMELHTYISSLTFPYLILTKFNKNPIKFTSVTCATNSYSCHAGNFFF